MTPRKLKIATRGSALALWQAEFVASKLNASGVKTAMHVVKTTGDLVQDRFLSEIGGKGLFVKELEEAMLAGHADIAIHSLKDVPVNLPPAFRLGAILRRHAAHDILIVRKKSAESAGLANRDGEWLTSEDLSAAGPLTIGTSSLRRASLFSRYAAKFKNLPVRGNVDTRLHKLHEGQFDAIVLAAASLERLGAKLWDHVPRSSFVLCPLPTGEFVPCAGQGALAIEVPNTGDLLGEILDPLHCHDTAFCVNVERSVLRMLGGDCTMPFGSFCEIETGDNGIRFASATATLLNNDGLHASAKLRVEITAEKKPDVIGAKLLTALSEQGAADILKALQLPVPDVMRLH